MANPVPSDNCANAVQQCAASHAEGGPDAQLLGSGLPIRPVRRWARREAQALGRWIFVSCRSWNCRENRLSYIHLLNMNNIRILCSMNELKLVCSFIVHSLFRVVTGFMNVK
jgi:hypothetical protein